MANRQHSSPGDWAAADAQLRQAVVIDAAPGPAFRAALPCLTCGSRRRYHLTSGPGALCRCLDCGRVTRRCATETPRSP